MPPNVADAPVVKPPVNVWEAVHECVTVMVRAVSVPTATELSLFSFAAVRRSALAHVVNGKVYILTS